MPKRLIADDKEILKVYTSVLRSEEETTANRLKASELLMKLKEKNAASDDEKNGVIILDDIPKQSCD